GGGGRGGGGEGGGRGGEERGGLRREEERLGAASRLPARCRRDEGDARAVAAAGSGAERPERRRGGQERPGGGGTIRCGHRAVPQSHAASRRQRRSSARHRFVVDGDWTPLLRDRELPRCRGSVQPRGPDVARVQRYAL